MPDTKINAQKNISWMSSLIRERTKSVNYYDQIHILDMRVFVSFNILDFAILILNLNNEQIFKTKTVWKLQDYFLKKVLEKNN